MNGYIATPYTPKSRTGQRIIEHAIQGTLTDRGHLGRLLWKLREIEGRHNVQHCLAWLDWIGGYPHRS